MVPLIEVLVAILGVSLVLLYNYKEDLVLVLRFSRIRSKVKDVIREKPSVRKKIVIAAIELSVFVFLIYLVLTMKIFWTVVVSNSMYPTFERGDMVLVQTIFVEPEKGDIVMFVREDVNLPVTHRVLDVKDGLVYTGGDASGPDSTPVPKDKIIGEVVTIFGKPVVVKGVGNYFILDAKELRDITPFGEEYLFYKSLVEVFRTYALAIIVIAIAAYLYLSFREITF